MNKYIYFLLVFFGSISIFWGQNSKQKEANINKKNIRETAYYYRDQALFYDSLKESQKVISNLDSAISGFLKLNFVEYPSVYALRQSEILLGQKNPKVALEKLKIVYDSVRKVKNTYSNKYVLNLIENMGKISLKNGQIDSSIVYFTELNNRYEKGKLTLSSPKQAMFLVLNEKDYYLGNYKKYLQSSNDLIVKLIENKNHLLALNVLQLAFTRALMFEDKEYLHEFKNLEARLSKLNPIMYQNKYSYTDILKGYESLNNADFQGISLFVPKEESNKPYEIGKDTLGYCQLLYLQTHALLSKGKIEMAQNKIVEANNLMDLFFAEDHPAKLPFYDLLSEVNYQLSDFGNAIDILKQGFNITHKYLAENHVEEIMLDYSLGKIEKSLGKTDESIAILHKADSLGHEKLPYNHLINGYIENQLGEAFFEHQDFNVSRDFLNKALKDYEGVVKEKKNVLFAKVYDDLGKVYQNTWG